MDKRVRGWREGGAESSCWSRSGNYNPHLTPSNHTDYCSRQNNIWLRQSVSHSLLSPFMWVHLWTAAGKTQLSAQCISNQYNMSTISVWLLYLASNISWCIFFCICLSVCLHASAGLCVCAVQSSWTLADCLRNRVRKLSTNLSLILHLVTQVENRPSAK